MQQGIITFLDCFLDQAKTNPSKPFIIFEQQTLTYQDVDRRSNKFANAFRTEGSLKKGDIVAQLMCNEPDFICVWLGLCKLGCEVAFVNVNIKAKSLLHCFQNCGAKTLFVGAGSALFLSRFYSCWRIVSAQVVRAAHRVVKYVCEISGAFKMFLVVFTASVGVEGTACKLS